MEFKEYITEGIKWSFIEDAPEQGNSDGFWYGITNGYINPKEVLSDKGQLKKVEQAIKLLEDFENAMEKSGLLADM